MPLSNVNIRNILTSSTWVFAYKNIRAPTEFKRSIEKIFHKCSKVNFFLIRQIGRNISDCRLFKLKLKIVYDKHIFRDLVKFYFQFSEQSTMFISLGYKERISLNNKLNKNFKEKHFTSAKL